MIRLLVDYRKILAAVTRLELIKKYSGSIFGKIWIGLYPVLFLSIYLFVYMIIFKMKLPGSGRLSYVVYVFAGLIPYIGFMETVTSGCTSLKQNMHLIKNVMLPIELIPARYVLVAMTGQLVGLGILLVMIGIDGGLGVRLLMLPVVLALQLAMLLGLVLILAPLGVLIPDITYFVSLSVLFLVFVSPIGFTPDSVPAGLRFLLYLNPLSYMMDEFRWALLENHTFNIFSAVAYPIFSIGVLVLGCRFFMRFKDVMVDFE